MPFTQLEIQGNRPAERYHQTNNLIMGGRKIQLEDRQFTLISKAVADRKRFEILQKIGDSKDAPSCSCLGKWVGLAPATISHHLKELENAGLIDMERDGKFAYITLRRDVWKAYVKRLSSL
jgi:ArsR family transcriptional regulator, arsenate/arsenite/antimonite-responsive transcriptional repressor